MFKSKTSKDFDVIVGLNSSVDGDIVSEGSVRIDGKVSGSVKSQGDVIIGDNAVVQADVEATYCEISGEVTGAVHSDTHLKIFKTGKLKGDITVSSFTIEEGGVFQGNCNITPERQERSVEKKPKKEEIKEEKKPQSNQNKQKNNNQQQKKTVS